MRLWPNLLTCPSHQMLPTLPWFSLRNLAMPKPLLEQRDLLKLPCAQGKGSYLHVLQVLAYDRHRMGPVLQFWLVTYLVPSGSKCQIVARVDSLSLTLWYRSLRFKTNNGQFFSSGICTTIHPGCGGPKTVYCWMLCSLSTGHQYNSVHQCNSVHQYNPVHTIRSIHFTYEWVKWRESFSPKGIKQIDQSWWTWLGFNGCSCD